MRIRQILLVAVIIFIGCIANTNAQNNIADEVVWMVGDEPILKSDVEQQKLRLLSEPGMNFDGNPDCFIPENIAIQKLFLNQAKIDSITADENQVNRYVEMWLQNAISQVGGKDKLEEYFGKKISQIRVDERKEARNQEIVRAMQQKIVHSVQVSPSEIRAFYSSLDKDSIPFVPETVEVQIITLQPKIELAEIDRVKKTLREYADDVRSGKRDFSTIARLYSQDKKTAIQGGEYGYVGKSSLDNDFAQAVFNLSKNRPLSSIVKTESGYHLVQLIDKRGDMVNFRHILLRPQVADSSITAAISVLDTISNDIRDGKISFSDAALYYSSDKDTNNNGGLMTNKQQSSQFVGSPNFQLQDLPQDIAKHTSALKVGEVSKPFILHNSNGIEEVAIVKLKAINKGHRANINEDYSQIKQMALQAKRAKKIDEWIRERQKTTFIEINDKYRHCDFKYPNWIHDNN